MNKIIGLLVITASVSAFSAGELIGTKNFSIQGRESAVVGVKGNDRETSSLQVKLNCRASIDAVSVVGPHGAETRLTGSKEFFNTANGTKIAIQEVKVWVTSHLILQGRVQDCTLNVYDHSSDIPVGPQPPQGTILNVVINQSNNMQIKNCVGNLLQGEFTSRQVQEQVTNVTGPQTSKSGRTILLTAYSQAQNGNKAYYIALDTAGINNGWKYQSSNINVGPGIGFSQWSYFTDAMSSVGRLMLADGSGQGVFNFSLAACWGVQP